MPIFGFKKRKEEKSQQAAEMAKGAPLKPALPKGKPAGQALVSAKPQSQAAASLAQLPAMPAGSFSSATDAIIRPQVTEKSGVLSQSGVYTFEVAAAANKGAVKNAIQALYKITPKKVAIINVRPKQVIVKGRQGTVAGMKKALVTVKKGDKIDFI